jgi:enhancing lycopene biosynthesis protein 2
MKKFAVVLSGCGFLDGSEVTETVCTLVSLGRYGAQYSCFAPDKTFTAINHLTKGHADKRNCMEESARISRGDMQPLSELKPENFDGVVFPGGFGAVQHLCNWAEKGAAAEVNPEAVRILNQFYNLEKPIAAMCIAPALVAKVLGSHEITLTVGEDPETAQEIEKTGACHENCVVTDFVTDRAHRVLTTPGYMYGDASPFAVSQGIDGMIKELVEIA